MKKNEVLTDLELLCFFFLSAPPSPSSFDRLLRYFGTSLPPDVQSYLVSREGAEQQLV